MQCTLLVPRRRGAAESVGLGYHGPRSIFALQFCSLHWVCAVDPPSKFSVNSVSLWSQWIAERVEREREIERERRGSETREEGGGGERERER